jgi:hypothetical protein
MVFLWCTGGEGCPADLILKTGGPITFDSRSGVSSLAQVAFWAFYDALLVDRRLRNGGSCMIIPLRAFQMWLSFGLED